MAQRGRPLGEWPEAHPALCGQWLEGEAAEPDHLHLSEACRRPQAVPEPPGAEKPHSEMDSRKHLLEAALGKRPEPQLSPGCRQPSPLPSPAAAWGQPSARSSGQQGLQTQDWVS